MKLASSIKVFRALGSGNFASALYFDLDTICAREMTLADIDGKFTVSK